MPPCSFGARERESRIRFSFGSWEPASRIRRAFDHRTPMTYPRFEDLPVWKGAMELAVRIFDWIHEGALKSHPGLRDQLERAVISISNNIAEGYERGTHEELVT